MAQYLIQCTVRLQFAQIIRWRTILNRTNNFVSFLFGSAIFAASSLSACVGNVPDNEGSGESTADAAVEVTPDADVNSPDAGEIAPAQSYEVKGVVVDYFAANIGNILPVANAGLSTDGLDPQILSTADVTGNYTMDILQSSLFYLTATATGYAPSRNPSIQMLEEAIEQNQFAASIEGIARQYSGAGGVGTPIEIIAGTGIIMVELQRNNGMPAIDIPAADIVLTTIADPETPVGTAFLVDPLTTDLSPIETTPASVVDGQGKARAGFLNVPPGEYNVSIAIGGGGGGGGGGNGGIQTVLVTVLADGASFALSSTGGGGGGGGGGGNAAIVLDPNAPLGFTEDIYPILQTIADGGDGCATCHNAQHPLSFIGTPEETLVLLNADAIDPAGVPRIDLLNPADSPFVTNPVFEPVPNHPNAFWTVNSNHYIGSVAWITQGAALLRADAVLPPPE